MNSPIVAAPPATGLARPLLDRVTPVPDAVVAALADLGIEHVVGMPGGGVGQVFAAMHGHPTIRAVLVREESIGTYMAEAYGRLRGRPLVVMGQGEWIAGNAGQGLLESLLGSSPVVVLTDLTDGGVFSHHGFYQSGSGDYGAWDAGRALGGVTKRVMVSRHPAQAVQHVQLAVKHAMSGEPGPVAVVFATTALQGTVDPAAAPRLYCSDGYAPEARPAPHPSDVERVRSRLSASSRPVFVAGNGVRVSGGAEALVRAAEVLDVPVVTTSHGKGVLPEDHPLAAGVIGAFGWPSANDVLADADLVVAVGTKLATVDTINESTSLLDPTRQVLVQVDVEPLNAGWTTPVAEAVVGDARAFLESLVAGAGGGAGAGDDRSPASAAARRVAQALTGNGRIEAGPFAPPFAPPAVVEALNGAVRPGTVVTCDAGENRLFMTRWYRTPPGGTVLQPAAGGGMGHAVPAALGAKLSDPASTVIAVCGDGGFAMSLHALMTSVEQELPIGVIILDNGALGWVLHGMGDKAIASTFAGFDYPGIARAIGCDGHRLEDLDELPALLAGLEGATRPLVIDVPTSLATSFRDILDPLDDRRRATGY